jgi:hypothetical protein
VTIDYEPSTLLSLLGHLIAKEYGIEHPSILMIEALLVLLLILLRVEIVPVPNTLWLRLSEYERYSREENQAEVAT